MSLRSNDPEVGIALRPDEYLLLESQPDITAARRWRLVNRIRREKGGTKNKLLKYFLENVGQIVTTEELAYVANKAKEYARRIRELRTEEGYPIATMFTGRPDLNMGEYVLESAQRISEPHDRNIPFQVEKEVYRRAGNACQLCGWNRDRWTKKDPRILELHHLTAHAAGGANVPENLAVLCSKCHDDVHAGRRSLPTNILG